MTDQLSGPASDSTKIKDLIPSDQLSQLAPNLQDITKGDLVALANKQKTPEALNLSVSDLHTISSVISKYGSEAATKGTVVCCCCAPCCCCTAVSTPKPLK